MQDLEFRNFECGDFERKHYSCLTHNAVGSIDQMEREQSLKIENRFKLFYHGVDRNGNVGRDPEGVC